MVSDDTLPIPRWLLEPVSRTHRPPARSRLPLLPFDELDPWIFERLCVAVALDEGPLESCRIYGTPGQHQDGIDLYGRLPSGRYVTYQCKRYRSLTAAVIRKAVAAFRDGQWRARIDRFVLCTSSTAATTQLDREIERQRGVLRADRIALDVWDAEELSRLLKTRPRIVLDFFDQAWVNAFCTTPLPVTDGTGIAAEILYGRGPDGRVFVSSPSQDGFAAERESVREAIEAIPRMRALMDPLGEVSHREALHLATTSDCFVLLLGSDTPSDCRAQYDAARAAGVHCFVLVDRRETRGDDVSQFVSAERDRATVRYFSDPGDLARQVNDLLMRHAVVALRQVIVTRREQGVVEHGQPDERGADWAALPATRRYAEMGVALGEAREQPETFTTVADLVTEQRELADAGQVVEAFANLHGLAFDLYEFGRADFALEVIEDLRTLIAPGDVSVPDEAWLWNTEALALSRLGRIDEADVLWKRMADVGGELDDGDLQATALQNLATSELVRGDLTRARERVRTSISMKLDLGDTRAVLQLLNTAALIAAEEGDLETAHEDLDIIEKVANDARDHHLLASVYGNRGRLFADEDRLAEAERAFREGLKQARLIGDAAKETLALQSLGTVCADQGKLGDALRWYRKGVRLAETFELPVQVESLYRGLATTLHRAGRNREAIEAFGAAQRAAQTIGDRHLWAESTANVGAIHMMAANESAALAPLEDAIAAFRTLGDLEWELRCRRNLAEVLRSSGAHDRAMTVLTAALGLLAAGAHDARASVLRQMAESALEVPTRLPAAAELFARALDEEAAVLDPAEVAQRAASAGQFLRQAGSGAGCEPFYDRAVEGLRDVVNGPYTWQAALNDRAVFLGELKRYEEARADLEESAAISTRCGDTRQLQQTLANLGEVLRQTDDPSSSITACRRALELARELDDEEATVHAIENLGLALAEHDEVDAAHDALQELEQLARDKDVAEWKAPAEQGFARVAFVRGQFALAAERYGRAAQMHRTMSSGDLVFSLGGRLESLARVADRDATKSAAEELIALAPVGEDVRLLVLYLGRSAISWLGHGDLEVAIDLFRVATLLGAQEVSRGEDPGGEPQLETLMSALCILVIGVRETAVHDEEQIYSAFAAALDRHEAGLSDALSTYLDAARDAFESDTEPAVEPRS
jgi:tetratricopeptide (TPR) repeat protein